jgi:peptidyl-prolyl cis-trans isomerase SurA
MAKRNFILLALTMLFSATTLFSAGKQAKPFDLEKYAKKNLITIGGKDITFGEVKRSYDKNAMRDKVPFEALSRDSAEEFIDTYTKYKLKVMDGINMGLDKDTSVINEVERNKRVLAESFLLDECVVQPAIDKFLERRQVEKKIAVIICHFQPNGDTTKAYQKITAAEEELARGATFDYVAKKYSSDTVSSKDGGVLPMYITALRLQQPIEDPIYSLKVGEYTKTPIKTGYGYFIIKLLEEMPRTYVGMSHILIPFTNSNEGMGPIIADSAAAKKLADSLYQALQNGANFTELAKKFSADKQTADSGGNLGIYSRSGGFVKGGQNILTAIETAVYEMKDGQVSKPVKTKLGYHLVRRDSTVKVPYDFELSDIRINYNKQYFQNEKARFYDSMAVAACGYKLNENAFNELLKNVDTTKTAIDTNFCKSIPETLKSQTLYSIDGKNYTVGWFADTMHNTLDVRSTPTNTKGYKEAIHKFIVPIVLDVLMRDINKTHPQFQTTMDEFTSGILLFKAEAANVWNKLKFDTVRAKKFYDTTSIDLTKPLQYNISEIYILKKDKIDSVYNELIAGKYTFDSAAALYTQRSSTRSKHGMMGLLDTTHKLAQTARDLKLKVDSISKPFKYENGYSIIKLNAIDPERRKTFEESMAIISAPAQAAYQKELENDWIKRLEKEGKVKVNNKLVKEIWKN